MIAHILLVTYRLTKNVKEKKGSHPVLNTYQPQLKQCRAMLELHAFKNSDAFPTHVPNLIAL